MPSCKTYVMNAAWVMMTCLGLIATQATAGNNKGSTDSSSSLARPVVRFTSDSHGCTAYPVKFRNQTTNAVNYLWDFGDGKTSSEKEPVHVYSSNGVYVVSLTATNRQGSSSAVTFTNVVIIESLDVNFKIAELMNGNKVVATKFTNQTTFPNLSYIWDFGDGNTANTTNAEHKYDTPGEYQVRLVAYNKSGCSSSKLVTYIVEPAMSDELLTTGEEL